MTDSVVEWIFLAIQLFAWIKCRDYNFVLSYADTATRRYLALTMLFWFAAGALICQFILKIIHCFTGG